MKHRRFDLFPNQDDVFMGVKLFLTEDVEPPHQPANLFKTASRFNKVIRDVNEKMRTVARCFLGTSCADAV